MLCRYFPIVTGKCCRRIISASNYSTAPWDSTSRRRGTRRKSTASSAFIRRGKTIARRCRWRWSESTRSTTISTPGSSSKDRPLPSRPLLIVLLVTFEILWWDPFGILLGLLSEFFAMILRLLKARNNYFRISSWKDWSFGILLESFWIDLRLLRIVWIFFLQQTATTTWGTYWKAGRMTRWLSPLDRSPNGRNTRAANTTSVACWATRSSNCSA